MTRVSADDVLAFAAACSPRPVTPAMAAAARGTTQNAAQHALSTLAGNGFVERMSRGRYRATPAGVALAAGDGLGRAPMPPRARAMRTNSLHARLWGALRKLRKGTIPDLVQLAARGDERAAEGNARRYLRALCAAGFVREMKGREPGASPRSPGRKRYILVRDPGPAAPGLYARRGRLRDPNSGETFDIRGGAS